MLSIHKQQPSRFIYLLKSIEGKPRSEIERILLTSQISDQKFVDFLEVYKLTTFFKL